MLSQISPSKEFMIVWNGSDPNDTDTLYVQAKVYNAHSGALLKTVSLVDRGSHYFSAPYITPQDPNQAGTGLQIVILITVYTDSGYTTPSQNYARISNDYLVKKLVDASSFWGGGGDSFDPKELRKIVKEELAAMKPPSIVVPKQELPKQEKLDDAALKRDILKGVKDIVESTIPEAPETVDLSPVLTAVSALRREIAAIPHYKEPDLSPFITQLHSIANDVATRDDGADKKIVDVVGGLIEEIRGMMQDHGQAEFIKAVKDGRIQIADKNNAEDAKKKNFLESLKAKYKP